MLMPSMRRLERAIAETETLAILEQGEYGVLSTISEDGTPYGLPLSYCLLEGGIYFHCALEGHKLNNLAVNPKVSFCVVGATEVLPDKFATRYESAIVFGTAREVTGEHKQRGLEALVAKYSSNFVPQGLDYIRAAGNKTKVFRIEIESMTGKARP
jgi:nitroimidazol reductase NimA-like FMN-containing flavoprotein (pyridoxamine 5'-phosphate oxidase superfamily)